MCVADGKYCFCMFNLTKYTTINYDDTWKIKRSKKKKSYNQGLN